MKQTIYTIEFYDINRQDGDDTIFQMTLQRMDMSLLALHQPNNEVFFKLPNVGNPIKFTVDNQKPRQIIYSLNEVKSSSENDLVEIKVRIPLSHSGNDGENYEHIPKWWKDIELIS